MQVIMGIPQCRVGLLDRWDQVDECSCAWMAHYSLRSSLWLALDSWLIVVDLLVTIYMERAVLLWRLRSVENKILVIIFRFLVLLLSDYFSWRSMNLNLTHKKYCSTDFYSEDKFGKKNKTSLYLKDCWECCTSFC